MKKETFVKLKIALEGIQNQLDRLKEIADTGATFGGAKREEAIPRWNAQLKSFRGMVERLG